MRLSTEARIILQEAKLEYLRSGITKSSGDVLDDLFSLYKDRVYDIDWELVRNNPSYDGILADYTSVNPTTLNLNNATIETIEMFRKFFNTEPALKIKRTVYRSYIIRMVLKAYILEKEKKQNIRK
ncbi:hypothetical protein BAU15_14810 [Enterococcus sp. JM4C]|nr:hypothetical protein BAU15_14810 [Enterococcus sp. JM4C]